MANAMSCTLFLLLLALHGSIQKSTPADPTYKAAVVEFKPAEYLSDPARTLNENARKCVSFIEQAASKDADIVVFPELCLPTVKFLRRPNTHPWASLIPDPSENYEPCTNFSVPVSQSVKMIACAARENSIYVVINVVEQTVCSGEDNCHSDGFFYYISNVVFDREGKIVARARKNHLMDEFTVIDVMETLDVSTFDTDFGVTFGNIVCYDIMFEEPGRTQIKKLNVTDIIFTSGWFSTMPFLTTIQMEAGWAYAHDVNLLASGYNKVSDAYSGTGIYAGRQGIVAAIIPLEDHEELLVAEVLKKSNGPVANPSPKHDRELHLELTSEDNGLLLPNSINQNHGSQSFAWKYENLDAFETEVIATDSSAEYTLSHMGIKCEFQVNITNLNPPVIYRLFVLDGLRPDGLVTCGIRVCVIAQCANDTLDSCGHIQNTTAIFNHIGITATYVDNGRTLMMPNTLGTNMLPLENWAFDEYKHERHMNTTIFLTKPTRNLVTFGVWGRNYERDIVLYRGYSDATS